MESYTFFIFVEWRARASIQSIWRAYVETVQQNGYICVKWTSLYKLNYTYFIRFTVISLDTVEMRRGDRAFALSNRTRKRWLWLEMECCDRFRFDFIQWIAWSTKLYNPMSFNNNITLNESMLTQPPIYQSIVISIIFPKRLLLHACLLVDLNALFGKTHVVE